MFDTILFPTDGSDGAQAILEHVLDIAAAHGATLHLLYVADTTQESVLRVQSDIIGVLQREGTEVVESAADAARDRGVDVVPTLFRVGRIKPYSSTPATAQSISSQCPRTVVRDSNAYSLAARPNEL